jgi:16S rRNA processing protein RimM
MVVLGKVGEAYGIKGWVWVHPYADDPDTWSQLPSWWLGQEGRDDWRAVSLLDCRWHGDGLVASLDGIADRNTAEALKGQLIAVQRQEMPEPDEDEFYWGDLVGLLVVNRDGQELGRVRGLIETGANDVLQVLDGEGAERLLPFVAAVILEVDVAGGRIVVDWQLDW